ncbi:hypothetical protein TWF694_005046 [Orbilia ellipsospora]|uniref:Uncharacterized protein n=1 Tax=Orbilia ellipsospora TaxID=2528407 RepID=A0AAV9WUK7_9PEZI
MNSEVETKNIPTSETEVEKIGEEPINNDTADADTTQNDQATLNNDKKHDTTKADTVQVSISRPWLYEEI